MRKPSSTGQSDEEEELELLDAAGTVAGAGLGDEELDSELVDFVEVPLSLELRESFR